MSMSAVRYHLLHDTIYRYTHPVSESRQMIRLSPRALEGQRCLSHRLLIDPEPSRTEDWIDSFGNHVRTIDLESSHEHLLIRAESWVELTPPENTAFDESPPWEQVRDTLAYRAGRPLTPEILEASPFCFESPNIRLKREFAAYALEIFTPGRPLLAGVKHLMARIFSEFTFDPEATDVATPVTEVFAKRRGVCQDLSHVMISCLRSIGLASRYVSGYLLTLPPPGKPRLIGADATHAWVSVFCPGIGWFDFDPTNNTTPQLEHITVGWGRDFADVSPVRGVILGAGSHTLDISVTVVPEAEFSLIYENGTSFDRALHRHLSE
ncbi:MAG: transglutaminase family protein [Denitromonas halophila]|nr:MAG: transglutaminase family protein [Denitromonas halophila]TVT71919.1 MAG: transglutaminase family protein [Denitromonas halophila]